MVDCDGLRAQEHKSMSTTENSGAWLGAKGMGKGRAKAEIPQGGRIRIKGKIQSIVFIDENPASCGLCG